MKNKEDTDIETYINEHGFGVSSRLLNEDEPITIHMNEVGSWKSQLLMFKIMGIDYEKLSVIDKLVVRVEYLVGVIKNKIRKR